MRVYLGILVVTFGVFFAIEETIQRLGGSYFVTSAIAYFGGLHVPYGLNMVGCGLLVIMGLVLVFKAPKKDPQR